MLIFQGVIDLPPNKSKELIAGCFESKNYESTWDSSLNGGENTREYLKPQPRGMILPIFACFFYNDSLTIVFFLASLAG